MEQQDNQEKKLQSLSPRNTIKQPIYSLKKKKKSYSNLTYKKKKKIKQQTFQQHYKTITGMSELEKKKLIETRSNSMSEEEKNPRCKIKHKHG